MPFREIPGNYQLGDAASFVGKAGNLVVDAVSGNIYVQNGVTPGTLLGSSNSGGSSNINRADLHISSAQLLAIGTTPLTVVPAPGPGFALLIVTTCYSYIYGTTTYSGGGGGIVYGGNPSIMADEGDQNVFAAGQSEVTCSYPSTFGGPPWNRSDIENTALTYASVGLTGGDGTGIISVFYSIISV